MSGNIVQWLRAGGRRKSDRERERRGRLLLKRLQIDNANSHVVRLCDEACAVRVFAQNGSAEPGIFMPSTSVALGNPQIFLLSLAGCLFL